VPADATTQPVEKPAATTPLPDKPLVCVYSGTLEAGQDILTAITAAKMLSAAGTPAEIHIAGTGKFEASIRAAAAGISGSCRVVIHGLLDRTAYVRLLSACDVGLVLVKPESLVSVPYKACDYAAAGLAIINSLPGEFESLVTSSVAGLKYTAGDAASLARAIASLASNRDLLLNYRQGARRLAEAEFDREKTYSQFAQWIEDTAS
jgi:glycosyltransferase involved in cell wall biosynthesis